MMVNYWRASGRGRMMDIVMNSRLRSIPVTRSRASNSPATRSPAREAVAGDGLPPYCGFGHPSPVSLPAQPAAGDGDHPLAVSRSGGVGLHHGLSGDVPGQMPAVVTFLLGALILWDVCFDHSRALRFPFLRKFGRAT